MMRTKKSVLILGVVLVALVAFAAVTGIIRMEPGEAVQFVSARGEGVELFGRGLYRYDSVFSGANFRAQDIVTLALAVPVFVIGLGWYRRGSIRGGLFYAAVLGFILYAYASMSFMAAFNPLFLVYVAILSASLFSLILVVNSLAGVAPEHTEDDRLPRRFAGIYMITSGIITLFVWLPPLLTAIAAGRPPEHLDHYTTMVTDALDLSVITPGTIVSGVLILRRRTVGYIIAMPFLGTIMMLVFTISGGTISQLAEGIGFTPGEIIGAISGFAVLGIVGTVLFVRILKRF